MLDLLKIVAVIVLILGLFIFVPILIIWALNTLFGQGIALTFKTWLAAFILGALVKGTIGRSRSN